MNTDHAVLAGTKHTRKAIPCQDYSLSGFDWGVVCDGCSDGDRSDGTQANPGVRTDVGSRVWALAFEDVMKKRGLAVLDDENLLRRQLSARAFPLLKHLGKKDGMSTLVAVGLNDGRVIGVMAGDGGFLLKKKNGDIFAFEARYSNHSPLYLDYFRTDDRISHYEKGAGTQEVTYLTAQYNALGTLLKTSKTAEPVNIKKPIFKYDILSLFGVDRKDAEVIAACTDGAFSRPAERGASLSEMMDFKNYTGLFAQRRLGFLSDRWTREKTLPRDDLAIAALHLNFHD